MIRVELRNHCSALRPLVSDVSIILDVYGGVLEESQQELAKSYGIALEQALVEHESNG